MGPAPCSRVWNPLTISVSPPSRILGTGCADSAVLRVRVPEPESPSPALEAAATLGVILWAGANSSQEQPPKPPSMVLAVDRRGAQSGSLAPSLEIRPP